jgi:hypothetical protein
LPKLSYQLRIHRVSAASLEIASLHHGPQQRIPRQIHGNRGSPLRAEHTRQVKAAPYLLWSKVYRPKDVPLLLSKDLQDMTFLRLARFASLPATSIASLCPRHSCPKTLDLVELVEPTNDKLRHNAFKISAKFGGIYRSIPLKSISPIELKDLIL